MQLVPDALWITHGVAEGKTPLNAFDNALLTAGIGNYNLIKVSSIAPKDAILQVGRPEIPAGALVPAVISSIVSQEPGTPLASCVGIGFGDDSFGMIMEHACQGTAEEAEAIVRRMIDESFRRRGLRLREVVIRSASCQVDSVACALAAVILWWR